MVPPPPLVDGSSDRRIVGWIVALHNAAPLPPVPIFADSDTRVGRSSDCEFVVPSSARHTSRIHSILRYNSTLRSWVMNVCGKHGVCGGVHGSALIKAQPGWISLPFISFAFAIPEDRLKFTVIPLPENFTSFQVPLVPPPPMAQPTLAK